MLTPSLFPFPNPLLIQTKHGDTEYNCNKCSKSFKKETNLKLHLARHNKRFQKCQHCNKVFLNLKVHMSRHSHCDEKQHRCNQCMKPFAKLNHFNSHMQNHRLNSEEKHICKICSKSFNKAKALTTHLRRHKKNRSKICQKCDIICLKEELT